MWQVTEIVSMRKNLNIKKIKGFIASRAHYGYPLSIHCLRFDNSVLLHSDRLHAVLNDTSCGNAFSAKEFCGGRSKSALYGYITTATAESEFRSTLVDGCGNVGRRGEESEALRKAIFRRDHAPRGRHEGEGMGSTSIR